MKSLLEYAPQIREMYDVEKKSIRQIAKTLNTYPLAVYRTLVTMKVHIRDKSAAAKEALESGRAIHPTKGKTLAEDVRNKIGLSVAKNWEDMTQKQRDSISEKHKKNWDNKSDADKIDLYKKSHAAIAESARNGSKLERFLYQALIGKGYDCYAHMKILENQNLEVDLALPNLKIAIELDGPSHFLPIWGDDIFNKTQASDREKNGLLILNGYKVIRIQYTKSHTSNVLKQQVLTKLVQTIEECCNSTQEIYHITI